MPRQIEQVSPHAVPREILPQIKHHAPVCREPGEKGEESPACRAPRNPAPDKASRAGLPRARVAPPPSPPALPPPADRAPSPARHIVLPYGPRRLRPLLAARLSRVCSLVAAIPHGKSSARPKARPLRPKPPQSRVPRVRLAAAVACAPPPPPNRLSCAW